MSNKTGLPGPAEPWGRKVESRLADLERSRDLTNESLDGMRGVVDKTVVSKIALYQQFNPGVNGKFALDYPLNVQFVSSTGLFEVTVSASLLSMAGANIGVSFESPEYPAEQYYDLPSYGVATSSAIADVRYAPYAASRSTIMTTRPGIYKLSLYAYANTTQAANSQAYIYEASISVKAV